MIISVLITDRVVLQLIPFIVSQVGIKRLNAKMF